MNRLNIILISSILLILAFSFNGCSEKETVDEFQQRTQEQITNLTRSEKLQKIYKDALKLSKPEISGEQPNLGFYIDKVADELEANDYPIDELVSIMASDENIETLVNEGIDRKVAKGILTYTAIVLPAGQGLEGMSIYYMPFTLDIFAKFWDYTNKYGIKDKNSKKIYDRLQKSRYAKNFDLGL